MDLICHLYTTDTEIGLAIKSLHAGKNPGPDGYPAEFYKTFKHELVPLLMNIFNESLQHSHIPQTFTQASISLRLMKGKDILDCTSYHPISLLNVDFKVLSKLLA